MSDARNFLFNTDFPIDQIVYIREGSTTIGTGGTVNIAHGLPFIPNVIFYWSFDSDFATVYDQNVGPFPSGNIGFPFTLQVTASSDATNVILNANGTLGPSTVYYRIFAFQPSDYTGDVDPTASSADNFTLNTDFNYTKLLTYDKVTVNAGGTTTITHDLGYIPQVLAWTVFSGTSNPLLYSALDGFNRDVEVTTTSIIINNDTFLDYDFYYRIYADE